MIAAFRTQVPLLRVPYRPPPPARQTIIMHTTHHDDDDTVPELLVHRYDDKTCEPVPMTIVGGWLGAGKSTLVRHLMDELVAQRQVRVAIVQNEFSEGAVEDALVRGDDGEEFHNVIELANGCLCCSVKNDYVSALEKLVAMNRFGYIITECSGLADPGALASQFWVDDELELGVKLDGIVAVVDCFNLESLLESSTETSASITRQLAYADRILLNKTDLIDNLHLNRIREQMHEINPTAILIPTSQSVVPIESVLHIHAFLRRAFRSDAQILDVHQSLNKTGSSCYGTACLHDHTITNLVIETSQAIDLSAFENWLGDVLWDEDAHAWTIFRMKAILSITLNDCRHYLQGVRQLYDISPGPCWGAAEKRYSRLVIIGNVVLHNANRTANPQSHWTGKYLNETELRCGFLATQA